MRTDHWATAVEVGLFVLLIAALAAIAVFAFATSPAWMPPLPSGDPAAS